MNCLVIRTEKLTWITFRWNFQKLQLQQLQHLLVLSSSTYWKTFHRPARTGYGHWTMIPQVLEEGFLSNHQIIQNLSNKMCSMLIFLSKFSRLVLEVWFDKLTEPKTCIFVLWQAGVTVHVLTSINLASMTLFNTNCQLLQGNMPVNLTYFVGILNMAFWWF